LKPGTSRRRGETRFVTWQVQPLTASAFIKDLLDVPSPQAIEDTPIELDHDSTIIRHFLQFAFPHVTNLGVQLDWESFMELFQLCDRLQSPEIESALMVAIKLLLQQTPRPQGINPWEIFKFAARRVDVQLARTAIRAMDNIDDETRGWRGFFEFGRYSGFADVPSTYVAGLFFAGYTIETQFDSEGESTSSLFIDRKPWNDIARDFKPCS
jgi:hypothetical protein